MPARRVGVELGDPSANALRIELFVPRAVERIGHVDAAAVAADLDHLRAAVELAGLGMRRVRGDAADPHASRSSLRMERIAHVVLPQFAGAPARNVEELVVESSA